VVTPHQFCESFARSHYENFPVASRLLPASMRPHVAAVYAFARIADDLADEGSVPASDRLAALDDWERRLIAVTSGHPDPGDVHAPVLQAVRETVSACGLPVTLLTDLLSAFKQDVVVVRYATWSSLLDYCRRSANPVGRLVLRIAGHRDDRLDRASDDVCTALQLTNFWQDLEVDWRKGRVYVPADISAAAGAREEDLARGGLAPEWRVALEECSRRTRALFESGRGVCDGVRGRLMWELRATWLGGSRILDRLERVEYDVFTRRPTLGFADAVPIAWNALTWHRAEAPARAVAN
jgi:squalene synthase HpnC